MSVIVIFSGGQDSTTCLFWARERFGQVTALTFDYQQRHRREIEAATAICSHFDVPHKILQLGDAFGQTGSPSPLTDPLRVVDWYADATVLPGGLERTFIPGRNILFLTLAAAYATNEGISDIVTGVCQEDFGGYPDCRRVFIDAMEVTLSLGLEKKGCKPFSIHTPLMYLTKAETVRLAQATADCWSALGMSWTCYVGGESPCGHCHACLLRARGFAEAGCTDPALGVDA